MQRREFVTTAVAGIAGVGAGFGFGLLLLATAVALVLAKDPDVSPPGFFARNKFARRFWWMAFYSVNTYLFIFAFFT